MNDAREGICLLIRSLDRGGAERQAVVLARELARRGVPTCVILFYSGGALEAALEGSGVEVIHLEKHGRWDVLRFAGRLVRALRARKPQAIYGFLPTSNILLAVTRPFHRRSVAFGLFGSTRATEPGRLAQLERRLEPLAAHLATAVITNSVAGRDDAVNRGFPHAKIHVVYNGVDGNHFRFDPMLRAERRRTLGVSGPLVGIVARLDPIKDHETFIAGFKIVLGRHPSALALVVGADPGGRSAVLMNQAESAGISDRLLLTGPLDDLVEIYSACDVIVLSSRSEGVPSVVLEALACGTPCASTDVGDVRAVLADQRLMASVGDASGLAVAIEYALSLPSDRTTRAARRANVLETYGAERMVNATMASIGLASHAK